MTSTTDHTAMLKKLRAIRARGKKQIANVNDRLNVVAWDLAASNADINDAHVNKAVSTLDEALESLQVAIAVLNTVAVDGGAVDGATDSNSDSGQAVIEAKMKAKTVLA